MWEQTFKQVAQDLGVCKEGSLETRGVGLGRAKKKGHCHWLSQLIATCLVKPTEPRFWPCVLELKTVWGVTVAGLLKT